MATENILIMLQSECSEAASIIIPLFHRLKDLFGLHDDDDVNSEDPESLTALRKKLLQNPVNVNFTEMFKVIINRAIHL